MKIFNLDKIYSIVCNWKKTRSGFKHIANLCINGTSVYETKVNYYNRTWESFEYESILKKVIENYFVQNDEKEKYLKVIQDMVKY